MRAMAPPSTRKSKSIKIILGRAALAGPCEIASGLLTACVPIGGTPGGGLLGFGGCPGVICEPGKEGARLGPGAGIDGAGSAPGAGEGTAGAITGFMDDGEREGTEGVEDGRTEGVSPPAGGPGGGAGVGD